eukprot:jgi/Bigna1/141736/aug1.65_g16444
MEVVSTASRDQSGAAKCGQQQKKLVFLAIVCFLCHNYWEDRRAFPRSLRMEGLMNYGGPKHYSELPNIRREASSSDNYLSSSEDSDSDDEAAEILDLIPTDSTAFKQLLASKIIDSPVSQSESLERLRLLERALRSEENEGSESKKDGQMYKKVVDRILSRRQHHGEKSNLAAASSTSNRTSKMMKCSSKLVKGDYKIARMAAVLASAMNIYSLRCRFAPAAVKDNVLSKFEYTMQVLERLLSFLVICSSSSSSSSSSSNISSSRRRRKISEKKKKKVDHQCEYWMLCDRPTTAGSKFALRD